MCWGSNSGPSAATKQQQQATLEQTQQTMAFDKQLMDLFTQQFNTQKGTLDFLKGVMTPVISQAEAGKGFSDAEEAAMRTSATDTLSGQFTNAQAALDQKLKTSGDANVGSGVTVGADTALLEAEAQAKSGAQNQITLASGEQARSNLFNAANVLNGVAAQENPNPLASEANAGGNTVASLGGSQSALQNAITNANSSSFFGKLSGAFGTTLGSVLGGAPSGYGPF